MYVMKGVAQSNLRIVSMKKPRCKNGTRRSKRTGNCENNSRTRTITVKKKRRPVVNYRNKRTGIRGRKPRCTNGTRRSKKTGNCEKVSPHRYPRQEQTDKSIFSPPAPKSMSPIHQQIIELRRSYKVEVDSILRGEYTPSINKYLLDQKTVSPNIVQGCPLADIQVKLGNGLRQCLPWDSVEAKKLMLDNLRSKTPTKCKEIVAPKQFKSNCWFNSFFMIFFISDKGKKFNKWLRQTMITGKVTDTGNMIGRDIVAKLRLPLFILNKYIDASIRNSHDTTNFANVMDTNDIINLVNNAIGEDENSGEDGTLIAPVDKPSNPMRFYKGLYNAIGGDPMSWTRLTVGGDSKRSDISNFYSKLSQSAVVSRISKMIYIEIDDAPSSTFIKPVEFTVDMIEAGKNYNCTYKLDSAVLRDVDKEHFSSYITCNGKGFGSDGDAVNRLQSFDWKKRLNKSGEWKLAKEYPTYFDFTEGYQMLVYYLTNKQLNDTGEDGRGWK